MKLFLISLYLIVESKRIDQYTLISIQDNEKIGGLKMIYKRKTIIPRFLYLSGIKIPIHHKKINEEIIIFYKPLKKNWGNMLPNGFNKYDIYGKTSNIHINVWLIINIDILDFNKQFMNLRINDYVRDIVLNQQLNKEQKQFKLSKI